MMSLFDGLPRAPTTLCGIMILLYIIHMDQLNYIDPTQHRPVVRNSRIKRDLKPVNKPKNPPPAQPPLIIAHRGSSAEIPANTLPGFAKSTYQGADYIYVDVTITKDLKVICNHEIWLDDNTDVTEISSKKPNTYFVQDYGKNVTKHFALDFTLDEIDELNVTLKAKYQQDTDDTDYQVSTLRDVLDFLDTLIRNVGVIVSIKAPHFTNVQLKKRHAKTRVEELVAKELAQYDCKTKNDKCIIESSNEKSLSIVKRFSNVSASLLVKDLYNKLSKSKIQNWAKKYKFVSLEFPHYMNENSSSIWNVTSGIVSVARQSGLKVLAGVPSDLRSWEYSQHRKTVYSKLAELNVDGYITDFPVRTMKYAKCRLKPANAIPCVNILSGGVK